jgi:Flp pilus assembly protein TadG
MKQLEPDRRSSGQGLVEFALVIPFLLVIVLIVVNVGRSIYAFNTVSEAARTAARVAIVDQNLGDIQASVVSDPRTAWLGLTSANVPQPVYTCGGTITTTPALGCIASVKVTYQLNPFFFAEPNVTVSVATVNLSSTSAMPIERIQP